MELNEPNGAQMESSGAQTEPERRPLELNWSPVEPKCSSNGAQIEPNGAQMEPGGAQMELQWRPMELKCSRRRH